jgi:rod shape-determining protein MreD
MRRHLFWAIFVMATAVFQTTWLGVIRVGGVLPDLILLLVVYFAVVDGEERAMFTGLMGGLFQDVAGDTLLGHHVICYVVAGFVVGRVGSRLVTEHPAVKASLVFGASLAHGLLFATIASILDPANAHFFQTVTAKVVPQSFYTALITPLIFLLLSLGFRRPAAPMGGAA